MLYGFLLELVELLEDVAGAEHATVETASSETRDSNPACLSFFIFFSP
jgi:hypothetical protein